MKTVRVQRVYKKRFILLPNRRWRLSKIVIAIESALAQQKNNRTFFYLFIERANPSKTK